MNIILYLHTFLPKIGGRELVVYYLAKAFSELGENVRIVGPGEYRTCRNKDYGVKVYRFPRFVKGNVRGGGFSTYLREIEFSTHLKIDMKLRDADIIHAHTTYPAGYLAAKLIKQKPNCKLVITPHGEDIHTIPEIGHGLRLVPSIEPKIRFALESADAITAISDSIRTSSIEAGASENKIISIPNGVDIERFQRHQNIDVRKHFGLDKESRLIVTVGNYHPRKGQAVIIDAMPEILKTDPHVRLIIIGKSSEQLESRINDHNLSGKVILTGTINFPSLSDPNDIDLLAAIYQSSEIYISAGIEEGSEGLSLAILEAMASGLPIIGTDISGNRELIKDGINGYLCKPASSKDMVTTVQKILSDDTTKKTMGSASFQQAGKYNWLEIAKQYLDLYKRVLSK